MSAKVIDLHTGKVLRYPPERTDKEAESWFDGMCKEIDRELDLLVRYGDPYYHYVAWREEVKQWT